MGSDESRFNVSSTVKDKVTRQCPKTAISFRREAGAEAKFSQGHSACQPYRQAKPAHIFFIFQNILDIWSSRQAMGQRSIANFSKCFIPPTPPFSPALISLMVSVDVKHQERRRLKNICKHDFGNYVSYFQHHCQYEIPSVSRRQKILF